MKRGVEAMEALGFSSYALRVPSETAWGKLALMLETALLISVVLFSIRRRSPRLYSSRPVADLYNALPMDLGLKERVAIIAASSQGIGKATAEAFAAEGCRLAICARNWQSLRAVADQIRQQHNVDVLAEALDVTHAGAVGEFVCHAVAKFGSADICVTNAGGPPAKGFLAATLDEWKKAVEQNFLSTVYFAREVIPHMQRKRWGRIITITSITTKQPVADLVLSNAVRAAVVGLVKSLANEFGKDGILVNNVGPGYTATDRLKELAKSRSAASGKSEQEIFESWAVDAPLKRLGEPREIAETIVWLASERASYVTGQTVLVDGGIYKGL
jgi:3-oxoacyl-[acyl-carrier protein] reductase